MLFDKATEGLFLRMAHTSWIDDDSITTIIVIDNVGILLYWTESKAMDLKHEE